MTEQCQKCKKEQRYIVLEIVEFKDGAAAAKEEEDDITEMSRWDGVTLCRTCWMDIKKNSSILSEMIKYV
jgi:hypothetical protein